MVTICDIRPIRDDSKQGDVILDNDGVVSAEDGDQENIVTQTLNENIVADRSKMEGIVTSEMVCDFPKISSVCGTNDGETKDVIDSAYEHPDVEGETMQVYSQGQNIGVVVKELLASETVTPEDETSDRNSTNCNAQSDILVRVGELMDVNQSALNVGQSSLDASQIASDAGQSALNVKQNIPDVGQSLCAVGYNSADVDQSSPDADQSAQGVDQSTPNIDQSIPDSDQCTQTLYQRKTDMDKSLVGSVSRKSPSKLDYIANFALEKDIVDKFELAENCEIQPSVSLSLDKLCYTEVESDTQTLQEGKIETIQKETEINIENHADEIVHVLSPSPTVIMDTGNSTTENNMESLLDLPSGNFVVDSTGKMLYAVGSLLEKSGEEATDIDNKIGRDTPAFQNTVVSVQSELEGNSTSRDSKVRVALEDSLGSPCSKSEFVTLPIGTNVTELLAFTSNPGSDTTTESVVMAASSTPLSQPVGICTQVVSANTASSTPGVVFALSGTTVPLPSTAFSQPVFQYTSPTILAPQSEVPTSRSSVCLPHVLNLAAMTQLGIQKPKLRTQPPKTQDKTVSKLPPVTKSNISFYKPSRFELQSAKPQNIALAGSVVRPKSKPNSSHIMVRHAFPTQCSSRSTRAQKAASIQKNLPQKKTPVLVKQNIGNKPYFILVDTGVPTPKENSAIPSVPVSLLTQTLPETCTVTSRISSVPSQVPSVLGTSLVMPPQTVTVSSLTTVSSSLPVSLGTTVSASCNTSSVVSSTNSASQATKYPHKNALSTSRFKIQRER